MLCNTINHPDNFVTAVFGHRVIIEWPNFVMTDTPDREWYPVRAVRKYNYVKFISGDPRLMKEAGAYYNELFALQRKYQALERKEKIKYYQKEEKRLNIKFYEWQLEGYYFCYPQRGWKEQGLRLKTKYEVMKQPFQPLYTEAPMSEADLGIAPNGREMDRRIWEFKKMNRDAPEIPTTKKQLNDLYKYTNYQFGLFGNINKRMAKQYIHGHYYKPPGRYANVDTNLRHIDRFSQYNSSDDDAEITIEE